MNKKKNYNLIVYSLFVSLFILGTLTFRDYGIGIDDKFHRYSGLYWLNYLLSFTNFDGLQEIVKLKLLETSDHTLPSIDDWKFYGIFFDVPAAILELIFKLDNPKDYYELRHYLNFLFYFVGCIYFYKILNLRFDKFITFFGTCFFILSPRIYGDGFYNMKDIVFLTFFVISYYYCFKCFINFNIKNLILLAIFSAISIETRILGLSIPLSFLSFYLFTILAKPSEIKILYKTFAYLFFTLIFVVLFWPYLWSAPFENFLVVIKSSQNFILSTYVFFNGEYFNNDYLPYSYVPLWILMTTPVLHILMFFIGITYGLKRLYFRLINIEKNQFSYDLWRGVKEKYDLFILLNFLVFFLLIILLNIRLFTAWKHLYFLNFYLVYIAVLGLNVIYIWSKKLKKKIILSISLIFISLFIVFEMIKYHPYQGLYFNTFVPKNFKNKFEIDYLALSARHFFDKIFELEKNDNKIHIANASWTPLIRTLDIYSENEKQKIKLVGQNYGTAKYIYSNNISEVDKRHNNKYDIPKDFIKLYEYKIDGLLLYTVYKKKL